jgi:hypothetical protein
MVTKQEFLESFAKIILMIALICPVTSYFLAGTKQIFSRYPATWWTIPSVTRRLGTQQLFCREQCIALPGDKQSACHDLATPCFGMP